MRAYSPVPKNKNLILLTLQKNYIYVFFFWELRGLSTNFHIHVSVTLTDTKGNWDCGRAIPFLGIFVSNFGYWFFAVQNSLYSIEHILQIKLN